MYKVINVISDLNIGGAGKCLLNFLKYHNNDKFEIITIIPRGSLLKEHIISLGKKVIEIDGLADKSFDIKVIKKLKQIFKEEKPDIVHSHAAFSARIAAKSFKSIKTVYTRHSVFEPSKKISKGIGKVINGAINNYFSDRIIAVADAAKDNLIKTGVNKEKIVVIKNGVEPLNKIEREENEVFTLGIAARLTEVKGHIYILEAVKKLLNDGINVKLKIAGTGPYEDIIKKKISELKLNDIVEMLGFVEDVETFNNSIDLNINASFGTEATSLSLLEGMSIGLPAVVSDFGGNPGVIYNGINGFLFESKNSTDLYNKIRQIITNNDVYQTMKKNCLDIFNREFTAKIMSKNIENLYIDLMKGRG
ncbi:MAG: glycosyltransferase family 4 protein [Ruminococcaceae bacterium]|nr:glycosyltransferase family 4 protein [Oscillospiraceae bacterium]